MTASTATILTAAPPLLHSPPEPRLILRCPQCGLNQFLPANDRCRRCGVRFIERYLRANSRAKRAAAKRSQRDKRAKGTSPHAVTPSRRRRAAPGGKRASWLAARSVAFRRELGQRIRMRREACWLSRREFAAKSGIYRTHLNKIELGYREIQVGTFLRCAVALGVSPAELLRGL